MRILIIGATGTIGRAVVEALSAGHEIVAASRSKSPVTERDVQSRSGHLLRSRLLEGPVIRSLQRRLTRFPDLSTNVECALALVPSDHA